MRLILINPNNSFVGGINVRYSRWNRYRVWKPLGLLVIAGATPKEWETAVFDENIEMPNYDTMEKPDFVGITAFSSQAARAYELASYFRGLGVPVVMGGIHATMSTEEALLHVDSVVQGEAEEVWPGILEDVRKGQLQRIYKGKLATMEDVPIARHDLLSKGYEFGSVQFGRGCPHNCIFCSVTAFNGRILRRRPIDHVIRELKQISERHVLFVDDNLMGATSAQKEETKELFRAMIKADLGKRWVGQVTVDMADDDELCRLAVKSGCIGVFIGLESSTREGLSELNKKQFLHGDRSIRASVRRIKQYGILIAGNFIIGLDTDEPGEGLRAALAASEYGVDIFSLSFMSPLPGTKLWEKMEAEDRLVANNFPEDWKYYTLTFPVMRYRNFSWSDIVKEHRSAFRAFYSYPRILKRLLRNSYKMPLFIGTLAGSISFRQGMRHNKRDVDGRMDLSRGQALVTIQSD